MGPRSLLCALSLLLAAGCSSRSARTDRGGPIWPDRGGDRFRPLDSGDAGQGEGASADRRVPDLAPPDRWVHDFRPEALPSAWKKVPLLTAEDLHDVACVGGHVFVVGAQGTILHRGPGDPAFAPQFPPAQAADPNMSLFAVSFADLTIGMAAGQGSQLWQTTDLGATWTIAPQLCGAFLFDTVHGLHLSGPQEGFAAGLSTAASAGIKYFNPPGAGWTCSSTFAGEVFFDVFRQGAKGWAVGDTAGKIYRSVDQGLTWSPVQAGTSSVLRAVWFFGSGVGLAAGEAGTLVRSVDGAGQVWSAVSTPTVAALWDLAFWDAQTGWAVGAGGTILRTGDGGSSWTMQPSGTTARLEGVCFTSASEGWAVGEKGTLLHTTSGGS